MSPPEPAQGKCDLSTCLPSGGPIEHNLVLFCLVVEHFPHFPHLKNKNILNKLTQGNSSVIYGFQSKCSGGTDFEKMEMMISVFITANMLVRTGAEIMFKLNTGNILQFLICQSLLLNMR